jgi:O-antigen ligase
VIAALLRPLHALIVAPSWLFLATMVLMLFHPPDYQFHSIDRIALGLLIFVVLLRVCLLQRPMRFRAPITLPMLGMLTLAFAGVVTQPYAAENWSLFAAKWLVPFALYHLAAYVFDDEMSLRRFETFALVVLGYLSLIAVLFLLDAKQFIFPRYILDEGLGIHADRARGPFLQAVANGVALNLLGLMALNAYRRGRLRGVWALVLLAALPLAIVATRTRAVWLSFAGYILLLLFFSPSPRLRRACLSFALAGALGLLTAMACTDRGATLGDRLEDSGPVMFRLSMYRAGWEMFLEKPVMGWGATGMQAELSKRIDDFHQDSFFFHNTYLEIGVQYGLPGLALYFWIVLDLFRLGQVSNRHRISGGCAFLDQQFRGVWCLMLGVYFLNGAFVVMNYQFVNGMLFATAGLVVAQNLRLAQSEASASHCDS